MMLDRDDLSVRFGQSSHCYWDCLVRTDFEDCYAIWIPDIVQCELHV